jgi:hypothetical protein
MTLHYRGTGGAGDRRGAVGTVVGDNDCCMALGWIVTAAKVGERRDDAIALVVSGNDYSEACGAGVASARGAV